MEHKKIRAVIIEPERIPRPIEIDNNVLTLSHAVNINLRGEPHVDFEPFEILEIKDDINIISSPKGEERSLPINRIVGRYTKLYGIIYIVKMKGLDLVSMSQEEAIDYCMKFMDKTISMATLGLPRIDYGDRESDDSPYQGGRLDITCDDW